jgi:hypothetical protein
VCVCNHIFCCGDYDIKNISTVQLKVIQTFSGVNKCTSCRHTFKHSTTQHTDSGFFIYTESNVTVNSEKIENVKIDSYNRWNYSCVMECG